jgi:hypothetical protein
MQGAGTYHSLFITAFKLGDNGDNDVAYELVQHTANGAKCLCDIAIQRHEGLWYISIDIDDGLIEVNDIDDILEYLELPRSEFQKELEKVGIS